MFWRGAVLGNGGAVLRNGDVVLRNGDAVRRNGDACGAAFAMNVARYFAIKVLLIRSWNMKVSTNQVTLAAAIFMTAATTTAAFAACENLVAAFDRAVAARSLDDARRAAADIAEDTVCGGRADEFQDRLVEFLVALAGNSRTSAAERGRAVTLAQRSLEISGNWRTAAMLADYFAHQGDHSNAFAWYEKSLSFVTSRLKTRASPPELQMLMLRASAEKFLVNDDQEGGRSVRFRPSTRAIDGKIEGPYSQAILRGIGVVPVPVPINFFTNEARFTPEGEQAFAELVDVVKEQGVRTMKLVGHADPRGSEQHNMDLSRRRAEAVRDNLLGQGIKAQITIDWKGSQQPFNIGALAFTPTQEQVWMFDRRVEWLRDGTAQ